MTLKISDIPIISLDLETGGLIPGKHTPLAIGAVVVPNGDNLAKNDTYKITDENSFYVQLEWDTMVIDPQAIRINKLDIINPPGKDGPLGSRSMPTVDGLCVFHTWLMQLNTDNVYVLGMNVGSFDLPMLRSIWQGAGSVVWPFHYRSIDLNSLFFALSKIQNKTFDAVKHEITQIAWTRNGSFAQMKHHALADAWSNVYIWEECLRRFGGYYEVLC